MQVHPIPLHFYAFLSALALVLCPARPDPDPLQDFCVALSAMHPLSYFPSINGAPCVNPNLVRTSHFATSALSNPGNPKSNSFGFDVTVTNTSNLPGINTMGLSMARVDIVPHGVVPPHSHPRASEVTVCLEGVIHVGFVDTSNRLFAQILRSGESFVFPKGLIHYMYNIDSTRPALSLSGLNSQNPGVQISSISNFVSEPQIPDDVLRKAFMITGQDIAKIRANLGG
ncbi:hypothetical protein MLD38_019107 [Melastoma candidum]|uniref:Uncharacterized protein n=1 Tax=Melastoma candidum TaxID=119954 RepID=A0ACB9QVC8_9MYRT|nr:hypothetical protein MLD38_019107 [Melastoma candidum]